MSDDEITLGELGRRITALDQTVTREVGQLRAESVLRVEYEARIQGIDREVRDIKVRLDAKVIPWPTVGALLVAVMALAVDVIPHLH